MKQYKLTFKTLPKSKHYVELEFDSDSDCLSFVTYFNSVMDSVKIIDVKCTIFSNEDLTPKSLLSFAYKVMYKQTGTIPNRILIRGDSDNKIVNVLESAGFIIQNILKENVIEI